MEVRTLLVLLLCVLILVGVGHDHQLTADFKLLQIMNRIEPSLLNKIPNEKLYKTQSTNHGTCTTYAENDYFQVACIRATFLGNITASLEAKGILVGTSSLIIYYRRAIEAQLHLILNFAYHKDSNGTPQLLEIRFCLDKAGLKFEMFRQDRILNTMSYNNIYARIRLVYKHALYDINWQTVLVTFQLKLG